MVLNSGLEDTIAAEDADYATAKGATIPAKIWKEVAATSKVSANADSLNTYAQRDRYHGPTSVSSQTPNIIMTVNRKTKQVLLTTTPRDAYARLQMVVTTKW